MTRAVGFIIVAVVCLCLGWFAKPEPIETDNGARYRQEIYRLRDEIKDLKKQYAKQIEKLDTVSTNNGVSVYINDFKSRAGGRMPTGRLGTNRH